MSLNGYNPFYKNIANENNAVYDFTSIRDLYVDSISAQHASFGYIEMQEYYADISTIQDLSCLSACFTNISFTNTLNNVPAQTFSYIAHLTSDAQQQLNTTNTSLYNTSMMLGIANSSLYNTCTLLGVTNPSLYNACLLLGITNSSFYNISALLGVTNSSSYNTFMLLERQIHSCTICG